MSSAAGLGDVAGAGDGVGAGDSTGVGVSPGVGLATGVGEGLTSGDGELVVCEVVEVHEANINISPATRAAGTTPLLTLA